MWRGSWLLVVVLGAAVAGCDALPGKPRLSDRPLAPTEIRDFDALYGDNCAGCHGVGGEFGAAIPLNNPVYLAIADDASMQRAIAQGVPGTAMPPFGKSAGGALTDEQIEILVRTTRQRWARSVEPEPPPYSAPAGDSTRGAQAYAAHCQSCHGLDGNGGGEAGSIVDRNYLSLVSDQGLRTLIIAGRPDLAHPDWRNYPPGQPLTAQEVADLVAWLASKRSESALASNARPSN
jgi:mono/diheme cytochrome c family protein